MVTIQANRILSVSIALLFIISTTHLIVHKPAYYSTVGNNDVEPDYQRALRKRSLPNNANKHVTSNRNKTNSESESKQTSAILNYAIFDASQFSGSLAFLDVQPEGWRTLVINLKNMSRLVTCESCFLLKDDWIKANVVDKIKWWTTDDQTSIDSNGLAKLAAYAYVLSQGAPWIYVTDRPVPVPFRTLMRVAKHEVKTGLVYQGPEDIFEPCNHFMDPYTWKGLGFHTRQGRYNVKVVPSHSVYHVVNECFRKGMNQSDWEHALDTKAPLPYVMPGTFAAVDFSNVLVSAPNVWTLIASVFPRTEDNPLPSPKAVQINLMVQRVLWDTQSTVGFLPDKSNVGRSCPSCDLQIRFGNIGSDLRNNLTQWRCEFFEKVPNCLMRLSSQDFLHDKEFHNLISMWISLLNNYSWDSSERHVFTDDRALERFSGIPTYFTPAKSLHKQTKNNSRPPNIFSNICGEKGKPYRARIPTRHPFHDILLIVIMNFGYLVSNIPLLDYAYGRHFKYIVYCSESTTQFENRYQKFFNANPVTFIEIKHKNGYWGQNCMAAAMKMGYDVIGFLQISDDVLLNAWNLAKLPYHKPWFQSTMRVANIHNQLVPDVWVNQFWWPWNQYFGRVAAVNAFNQLQAMVSNPIDGDRISKFLENLENITNCDHCFLYEASDIFYLPRHLAENFTFFSDIFSLNKVFLEITIPTVMAGITSDAEVYRLRGNYLWFQDREKYPFVYTEFDHFFHALKFSQLIIQKHLKFYCNWFLGKLDRDVIQT